MAKLTPINAGTQYLSALPQHVGSAAAIDSRLPRQSAPRPLRQHGNPQRRSLYDLLFYEVDNLEAVEPPVREQLKENIRDFFREKRRPRSRPRRGETAPEGEAAPESPSEEPENIADPESGQTEVEVPDEESFRRQQLAELSFPDRSTDEKERILHAIGIANQLKACLTLNSETSRRVSLYLRALLIVDDERFRPTFIIEV